MTPPDELPDAVEEPEGKGGGGLARVLWDLAAAFVGAVGPDEAGREIDAAPAEPADGVRLVHASDLASWERFPRCQDHDGITLTEYRAGAKELERRRKRVRRLLAAREELADLDRDEVIEVDDWFVAVPRSLVPHEIRIPLATAPRPRMEIVSSEGAVADGALAVRSGWRSRTVRLAHRGASRAAHAERIEELRAALDGMSAEQRSEIDHVTTSRFAHPVLFVSHRWLAHDHPDPDGVHLSRLRDLEDCYLIYDWSSFPQPPRSPEEDVAFVAILEHMDELISNVLILEEPDYLRRGWCVYEYMVAAISSATVLDEVADERFVGLRDWAHTRPPISLEFRGSFEASQQNYVATRVLESVDAVLPVYRDAEFRSEYDSTMVTGLLVGHLRRVLPPKRRHIELLGEWEYEQWTADEIRAAFDGGLAGGGGTDDTMPVGRFDTAVPRRLADAVERGYEVREMSLTELLDPTSSALRMLAGWSEARARRGDPPPT